MIQFISHYNDRYSYLDSIELALKGGCRWVQLRMKDHSDDETRAVALKAMPMCEQYGAVFVLDDRVELAKELGCGVHLGKNDMPIMEARKILGEEVIIGGTANTFEDLMVHVCSGASYIGCGPFRFTTTKKNLSPVLGLEGYRGIVGKCAEQGITVPIVAIGGITLEDVADVMATGVNGIALSGAVLNATDPVAEMRRFVEAEAHFSASKQ